MLFSPAFGFFCQHFYGVGLQLWPVRSFCACKQLTTGQPDEPPAVEVGSHLEVLVLIEEPEEDGIIPKEHSQWVAVVVVVAADGTAAHKKPTATDQMCKVNTGWFLVRYEDDGVEEWLRLPGDAFNNNARGSWRVDLNFEASGGIEGSGGGGGGGSGDGSEDESSKEESGDESEDDDSSSDEDEDEDEDDDWSYDGSDA